MDAYLNPSSSACDATQRGRFDEQVTAAYIDAAGYGKPLMMIGNSAPWPGLMPSTCQLQWFKDLADSRGDVSAVLWWLYATTDGRLGVREPQFATEKNYLFQMGQNVIRDNVMVTIDLPLPESVVMPGTQVGGWAMDYSALHTTGIDTIHIWAYPDPLGGPPPVFLGTTTFGDRPDVAQTFGSQFLHSGYGLFLPAQTPSGGFTMVVYAHSTETGEFTNWALRHLVRQ